MMPNHVLNEIIFRDVDSVRQYQILAKLCNKEGHIDFDVLVPTPPNAWLGNVGQKHEKLGSNGLDWARANWGTKWNAYGQDEDHYEAIERGYDTLTVRFQTAWSPPYGWLVAVFNVLKMRFEHNWLDEGSDHGNKGIWDHEALAGDVWSKDPWTESRCDDATHRHLHKLLWGVEEFDDEDAA